MRLSLCPLRLPASAVQRSILSSDTHRRTVRDVVQRDVVHRVIGMVLCLSAAACTSPDADQANDPAASAATPALAVRRLTSHLREGDLAAFARDAVPPALHARLDVAWRRGATRWPLDELPLAARLPEALATLAAPGSEAALQKTFDRQFAGAGGELRSTASTLGLFAVQYVRNEGDFSADERAHYAQLVAAVSGWARAAPLSDKARARAAIVALAAAARQAKLGTDADFAQRGMDGSLRALRPFVATSKRVLTAYGLDLDASLAAMDASLVEQTGDTARVRLRYRIAGTGIDTVVAMERRGGRWYVSDYLRRAAAAAARGEAVSAPNGDTAAAATASSPTSRVVAPVRPAP